MKYLVILLLTFCQFSLAKTELKDFLERAYKDANYYRLKISKTEVDMYREGVNAVFQEAVQAKKDIAPKSLYKDYYELAQEIHFSGYSNENDFQKWLSNYKELFALTAPAGDVKGFWARKYSDVFATYLKSLALSQPSCIGAGGIASLGKCCKGLLGLPEVPVRNSQCIADQKSCNSNSDCCSQACEKTDPAKAGICVRTKRCFAPKKLGASCMGVNPYCLEGRCEAVDKMTVGMGECRLDKKSCIKNSDCCSNSCSQGKCIENKICTNCLSAGKKVKQGKKCCPGLYKGRNGKCRINLPPMLHFSTEVKSKPTNIFKVLLNFIIPSAHAVDMTRAQVDMIDQRTFECHRDHVRGSERHKRCIESVVTLKNEFIGNVEGKLTQEQITEVEDRRNACIGSNSTSNSPDSPLAKCMVEVDKYEKEMKKNNKNLGISPENLSSESYIDEYEIPSVTAKTYSDIKKCEFNSFNDHWKDASNMEKNSEIFLRAFEFVYSNEGTIDYWEQMEGSEAKGNIFRRANAAALAFRENRQKMLKELTEIDRKMACKCVAIFGPTEFDQGKQDFFNKSCEEEKKELSADLSTNGQSGGSNVNGSSIDKEINNNGRVTGKIEEIDKGAKGLSHEKLLIEWLGLRKEATMVRFVDNSQSEEDLTILSEFISGYDFEEFWKDHVPNEKVHRPIINTTASDYIKQIPGANDFSGDSEKIYMWFFTTLKSWVLIFIVIATGGIGLLALPSLVGVSSWSKAIGGFLGGLLGFSIMSQFYGTYGKGAEPNLFDVRYRKKSHSRFKDKRIFDRWYVGPRYNNYSKVSDTNCKIYGRAASCLKSAYAVEFQENLHYVVDPTLPLFVEPKLISIKRMHKYSKNYVEMINDARKVGVKYLQELAHAGATSGSMLRKGKKYGRTVGSHVEAALRDRKFSQLEGKLDYKIFDKEYVEAVTSAAKKYALCKDLRECGAKDVEDGALGFGYLFEDESEAEAFAKYTYELHYLWSTISKKEYLGYPLLALDAYFKAVSYNMKVLGSMNLARSANYAEVHQLYTNDWKNRASSYGSLGSGALGFGSRNAQFGPVFFEPIKLLEFNGMSDIAAFDAAVLAGNGNGSSSKPGKFTQAELNTYNSIRSHAARINNDIEERKHYEKETRSRDGQLERNGNISKFLSRLNNPTKNLALNKFKDKKGGFGAGSHFNGLENLNAKSAKVTAKKSTQKNKPLGADSLSLSRKDNSYRDNNDFSFGDSNGSTYTGNRSSGENRGTNSGLSNTEVHNLLYSVKKNKNQILSDESDTLFRRVSKAYFRSYDRILTRQRKRTQNLDDEVIEEKKDESKKEILKNLLKDG